MRRRRLIGGSKSRRRRRHTGSKTKLRSLLKSAKY